MEIKEWSKLKQLPLTSSLIVLANVIVFLGCTLTGDLLYYKGGLDCYSVLAGKQYGRIIWAMFLHQNINHLFNNMFLLFFLGSMLEKEIGHIRLAVLYFLSGIGGNLLSLYVKVIRHDMTMSIGASGAVFGLDGVLLALVLFYGRKSENVTVKRVLIMIVLSLYSGYTGTNIDNAAHIGGVLTGFLLASIMCIIYRRKWQEVQ